jgi:hypothetical protein
MVSLMVSLERIHPTATNVPAAISCPDAVSAVLSTTVLSDPGRGNRSDPAR